MFANSCLFAVVSFLAAKRRPHGSLESFKVFDCHHIRDQASGVVTCWHPLVRSSSPEDGSGLYFASVSHVQVSGSAVQARLCHPLAALCVCVCVCVCSRGKCVSYSDNEPCLKEFSCRVTRSLLFALLACKPPHAHVYGAVNCLRCSSGAFGSSLG